MTLCFVMVWNFSSGFFIKFQGPDDPFNIICMNFFGRLRIYGPKLRMEGICALLGGQCFQFVAVTHITVIFCKINIIDKCLNIKACTAYNDGNFSVINNLFHGRFGHFLKNNDVKFFIRIKGIHKIMGNPVHFLRHNLGCSNIHVFVHLHGVCTNDLSANGFCQSNW